MTDPIKLDDPGSASGSSSKITIGAPSSSSPPPGGTANGGGMGNIFTQTQAKKEESKMISSIISQKDAAQKTKSILGAAPTLEHSIEQEREAALKRKFRFYQTTFLVLFLAGVGAALYFYSELSPDFNLFGPNTTQRLAQMNANLRNEQTLVSKDRYLAAQLKLNEFSYQADRFLSSVAKANDPAVSATDKQTFLADLDESQKALPGLIGDVRSILSNDIVVPIVRSEAEPEQTSDQILLAAQTDLRKTIQDEKKKYGQNPTASQDILDLKLIDNAAKLVGNKKLLDVLQKTSVDAFQKQLDDYAQAPDPQKLKALQDLIGTVLSSTKSDLATIADIKRNRVEWSSVIGQIRDETLNVDKNFGQPVLYDTLGGIVYNGYEFDANSDKIVLSGTTKTLDGSNFTLISNLIDQLENSQYFQNVQMRSFSKTKSGTGTNTGFTSNFKIDLKLQTGGISTVNLQGITTTSVSGTPRAAQQPATQETASHGSAVAPAPSVKAPGSTEQTAPASGSTQQSPAGVTEQAVTTTQAQTQTSAIPAPALTQTKATSTPTQESAAAPAATSTPAPGAGSPTTPTASAPAVTPGP